MRVELEVTAEQLSAIHQVLGDSFNRNDASSSWIITIVSVKSRLAGKVAPDYHVTLEVAETVQRGHGVNVKTPVPLAHLRRLFDAIGRFPDPLGSDA